MVGAKYPKKKTHTQLRAERKGISLRKRVRKSTGRGFTLRKKSTKQLLKELASKEGVRRSHSKRSVSHRARRHAKGLKLMGRVRGSQKASHLRSTKSLLAILNAYGMGHKRMAASGPKRRKFIIHALSSKKGMNLQCLDWKHRMGVSRRAFSCRRVAGLGKTKKGRSRRPSYGKHYDGDLANLLMGLYIRRRRRMVKKARSKKRKVSKRWPRLTGWNRVNKKYKKRHHRSGSPIY